MLMTVCVEVVCADESVWKCCVVMKVHVDMLCADESLYGSGVC